MENSFTLSCESEGIALSLSQPSFDHKGKPILGEAVAEDRIADGQKEAESLRT